MDIGVADGTSLIPAVSQGIPVVYGATIFGRFPNVLFALDESGIQERRRTWPAGRSASPAASARSWIAPAGPAGVRGPDARRRRDRHLPGLRARRRGRRGPGRCGHRLPQQRAGPAGPRGHRRRRHPRRRRGAAAGPGPRGRARARSQAKGDALRAFTAATLRAMEDIAADPQLGLDATFARVPELAADPETQLAILEATIDAWQKRLHRSPTAWAASIRRPGSPPSTRWPPCPDSVVARARERRRAHHRGRCCPDDGGYCGAWPTRTTVTAERAQPRARHATARHDAGDATQLEHDAGHGHGHGHEEAGEPLGPVDVVAWAYAAGWWGHRACVTAAGAVRRARPPEAARPLRTGRRSGRPRRCRRPRRRAWVGSPGIVIMLPQ